MELMETYSSKMQISINHFKTKVEYGFNPFILTSF